MGILDKFKRAHTCGGEDRDDPDSWDDPLIYDAPYFVEEEEFRNEVTPNDADEDGRRTT